MAEGVFHAADERLGVLPPNDLGVALARMAEHPARAGGVYRRSPPLLAGFGSPGVAPDPGAGMDPAVPPSLCKLHRDFITSIERGLSAQHIYQDMQAEHAAGSTLAGSSRWLVLAAHSAAPSSDRRPARGQSDAATNRARPRL